MSDWLRPGRLIWIVGLILLAGSLAGAGWMLNSQGGGPTSKTLPKGTASHATGGLVCTGYVDVESRVASLYPLQPGRVIELPVEENVTVPAETVLLRVDDTIARLRVQEAEQGVTAAAEQLKLAEKLPEQHRLKTIQQEAAIEAYEARLAAAKIARDRKKTLSETGQLSKEEVDAASELVKEVEAALKAERHKLKELGLDEPELTINRAKADLTAAQKRLEQAQTAVKEHVVRAPSEGKILRLLVSLGDALGTAPRQPALLFCANDRRIVRIDVEQEFAGRLEVNRPATIQDDVVPGEGWKGRVLRIADAFMQRRVILPEPFQLGQEVRTLECIIAFDSQPPVRIGQKVRVTIEPSAANESSW